MQTVALVKQREPIAFLTDEQISRGTFYGVCRALAVLYGKYMHDFSISGLQAVNMEGGILFVGTHTFHSTDILIGALYGNAVTGKVTRGLVHKTVMAFNPWLRFVGLFPGQRDAAVALLKEGNWCACLPGGVEELLQHTTAGGQHAYELCWQSHNSGRPRRGYAEVAVQMGPGFKVHPIFMENGEEMKWNPVFDLFTFLRLDVLYGLFLQMLRMLPKPLSILEFFFWQLAIATTFCLSLWISIPVPVKVTLHFGEGVAVQKGEKAEEFGARVQQGLEDLVRSKQRRRHRSYSRALADRFPIVGRVLQLQPEQPAEGVKKVQ